MLALEEVRRNKPDLIISDVKMPNVDGYAFCRTLSAEKETKDIPVILLTSYREAQEIKKGMDLGAVSFVQKPYKSEVLLSIVQGVIRGRA